MIISRTPYRISFFGGGTDYPQWYRKEGGAVLSTTIDKYCYLNARYLPPFFSVRHRIVWSHIETVQSIAEILHPAVREGLRYLGFDDSRGLEIHHAGDLPARSGIGSSSSFSVGLIRVLMALRGESVSRHALALRAIELEQSILREPVGCQDQVAAAHGGLNVIRFGRDGSIEIEPLALSPARLRALESRLLLVYSGASRLSSQVAGGLIANLHRRQEQLRAMAAMVEPAVALLRGHGDLDHFGRMLHEAWTLKRQLSDSVSSATVDRIYQCARDHGALGGKLLGAGAAGFVLLYVSPEKRSAVIHALGDFLQVPFCFETGGSHVIYDGLEGYAERTTPAKGRAKGPLGAAAGGRS